MKKNSFWDALSSVYLALILLIILAATSIIGTLIPQNATYQEYVQNYGVAFTNIVATLELFDMYHSWWFIFLLMLFSINLILCSLKRLPAVLDQIKNPNTLLTEELEKGLSLTNKSTRKGDAEAWKQAVKNFLQKKYGNISEGTAENRHYLYAEKGKYGRLGVYITHLSILLILAGGLLGAFWGFRGYVNIPEGATISEVTLRGGQPPYKLDFSIRCDKFSLAYYPTGMVKEYRSDITLIENGKEIAKDYLIVNRPFSYKGITFYQSSYGALNRAAKVNVKILAGKDAGKVFAMTLGEKPAHLPFPENAVQVINHFPDLDNSGPAMVLHIEEDGRCKEFPVFKNYPYANTNPGSKYAFAYVDYSEDRYTGLQATKDPGQWLVWVGCILMMAGLYYCFFVTRKRIWVRIVFDGNIITTTLAGHSARSRIFEDEFAKLSEELKAIQS